MSDASNGFYAVPAALVFRAWSRGEAGQPIARRILLKNDTAAALVYRLDVPESSAFRLACNPVAEDGMGMVEAGGGVSLEVQLVCDEIDASKQPEVHAELRVRTSRGVLHVPLVALSSSTEPKAGAPKERRSGPTGGERWPDALQLEEARRRAAEAPAEKPSLVGQAMQSLHVTAAAVSEREELAFYAELM
eukprot:scaffold4692_cov118-Isochrysis_galbana.AAC.1